MIYGKDLRFGGLEGGYTALRKRDSIGKKRLSVVAIFNSAEDAKALPQKEPYVSVRGKEPSPSKEKGKCRITL